MFVVERPNGSWELRETAGTPRGPRSRTLASFRELTPEVIARARGRAREPVEAEELRRAAARAGAPVSPAPADRAAATLLAELEAGRPPRAPLGRLVGSALAGRGRAADSNAMAAAAWIGESPRRRGEALRDLLLLTDSLPVPAARGRGREKMPRLDSRGR